ncbi:hypothetical protein LTR27_003659 [Elasticomyces elasticus]|nr:hypothetical protein LTR27_003659 [Elasticomyces elasticus]
MEEPFTLVEEAQRPGPHHLYDNVVDLTSGKTADHDLQYITALREANPGMIVIASPAGNTPLRAFAAAGFATCELDTETDSFASWRGFNPPALRQNKGTLAESIHFAKWHYSWKSENFILYTVANMQYVLKERRDAETVYGPSKIADALIQTVGDWLLSDQEVVWVFDQYWQRSKQLYNEVMKANWDKGAASDRNSQVILDESIKKDLTSVTNKFFSSKQVYEDLGVPWKRGLLFHGPPGNGKTISIKALMHTLLARKNPIPTLYVRNAPQTYHIRSVFQQARAQAPCMLILEDVETIVTPQTRSYFFNEMDGLENNDGLFVVASTNFLDRLDPGLSKRPSRFDRKYLFPLPNEHERTLYCEFWYRKLEHNDAIIFPKKLAPAMAHITSGFSFAFLQECFVATLLILARGEDDVYAARSGNDDELEKYEMWRVFKQQADLLRKEVQDQDGQRFVPFPEGSDWADAQQSSGLGYALAEQSDDRQRRQDEPSSSRAGQGLPNLEQLMVKDEMLPALRYPFVKSALINSAAFEYKMYD